MSSCPPDANVGVRRSERTLLRSRIRKLPRPEIYRAADAGPRNAPNPRRSLNLAGSSSICSLGVGDGSRPLPRDLAPLTLILLIKRDPANQLADSSGLVLFRTTRSTGEKERRVSPPPIASARLRDTVDSAPCYPEKRQMTHWRLYIAPTLPLLRVSSQVQPSFDLRRSWLPRNPPLRGTSRCRPLSLFERERERERGLARSRCNLR